MSSFIRTGWLLAGPGTGLLRRPGEPHAISWLAGAGLVVLLAGCAGQASVALPPKTGVQLPARLAEQVSQRQQVMDAYAGYWQASGEALNSGNARRASQILARYAPATALPGLIAALRQDWARHAVTDGAPVPHIVSVTIRGSRATVHDCIDLSHAGLRSARTGRVFPHSFGSPRANYYASLVRLGPRWLVSNIVPVVALCEP